MATKTYEGNKQLLITDIYNCFCTTFMMDKASVLKTSLSSVLYSPLTMTINSIVVEMFSFHLFKSWLVKFGDMIDTHVNT